MKQRERCIAREQTSRKDYEDKRKSMQSAGTRRDGSAAVSIESRRDGKITMPVNTEGDTKETSILGSNGQRNRKEILPSREQVLGRRPGASVKTNTIEPSEKWTIK